MFTKQGPTVRELAVQALSSTERGYDLLAPKFDHTPYRTPDRVLDAVTRECAASAPSTPASTSAAAPAPEWACSASCAGSG